MWPGVRKVQDRSLRILCLKRDELQRNTCGDQDMMEVDSEG